MEPRQSLKWARQKFLAAATIIAKDPKKILSLVTDVEGKLSTQKFKDQFKTFWDDLKILLNLLKDTATGKYKPKSKKNILLIILGLLYFLSPLDLVPDLLIGGFLDDAAVLAWIVTKVQDEITHYKN
ncbi:MAG: YkvA family protein [Bdellovibrionota bacterium]|jgi:uncharacterized membrane protein YkvA (DUF1232 family)|nr:YkvA family protein [Bdellovibrionota bacterium]